MLIINLALAIYRFLIKVLQASQQTIQLSMIMWSASTIKDWCIYYFKKTRSTFNNFHNIKITFAVSTIIHTVNLSLLVKFLKK